MRKSFQFLLIISLFFFVEGVAQVNLVVNPSFEDTVNCPIGPDDISAAAGWSSASYSPDYFNSCVEVANSVGVPRNFGGYQPAGSGHAYAGFCTYYSPLFSAPNFREYLQSQLSSPLTSGQKYFVSFRANLSIDSFNPSNCASNNIGVNFSTVEHSQFNPPNSAFISAAQIITDTAGWVRVFGSFVADSAYDYILVGNFFNDLSTDTLILTSDTFCISYYYVDDICVSTDSVFCLNYTGLESSPSPELTIGANISFNEILILSNTYSYSFEIRNALGQIVLWGTNASPTNYSVNIETLASGLYVLSIKSSDNNFYQFKFLKP